MAADILIVPNRGSSTLNPVMQFSGSAANTIRMEVLQSGSVAFLGNSGSLFSIVDSMSGSLMAVSDVSGLPILEVFSDDKVVMGKFNSNALVVTGSNVGVGKATPNAALDVSGNAIVSGSLTISGSANSLIFDAHSSAFLGRYALLPGRFSVGTLSSGYPEIGYNFSPANGVYTKLVGDTAWRIGFGNSNQMLFGYAASGTGTFSWTNALAIDLSSNAMFGTTTLPTAGGAIVSSRSVSATASPNYFIGLNLYNQSDGGARIQSSNSVAASLAAIDLTVLSSGAGTDDGIIAFHAASNGTLAEKARITNYGTLLVGDTTEINGSWYNNGIGVFGKNGTDKMIVGYLASGTGGALIGAHNSALNAWAVTNINGSQIVFRINESDSMRLNASGNLGIGISPSYKIHAYTTSETTIAVETASRKWGILTNTSWASNGFSIYDLTADASRLNINTSGDVGIGTTSPSAKLHVSGDVMADNVLSPFLLMGA